MKQNKNKALKAVPTIPKDNNGRMLVIWVNEVSYTLEKCRNHLSLMDEPQSKLFEFLKYLYIVEAFNTYALRQTRQTLDFATHEAEKRVINGVITLLQSNVNLYGLMQDKQISIFAFLNSVKRASTNTKKAFELIEQLKNKEQ